MLLSLFLAIPFPILTLTITNTTITMTWTLPSFAPQTYEGNRHCRRVCEKIYDPIITKSLISSPYTFTGIDPGTYCIIYLNGIYGNDPAAGLGSGIITTLSSGKLCYILIITIIILFSHYLQLPLHLSIISFYHQSRQGP